MQENHETQDFPQKMLNFFTFNQKLHFCKREHLFIEELIASNPVRPFRLKSLDAHDEATSRAISGPRSHDA